MTSWCSRSIVKIPSEASCIFMRRVVKVTEINPTYYEAKLFFMSKRDIHNWILHNVIQKAKGVNCFPQIHRSVQLQEGINPGIHSSEFSISKLFELELE